MKFFWSWLAYNLILGQTENFLLEVVYHIIYIKQIVGYTKSELIGIFWTQKKLTLKQGARLQILMSNSIEYGG